MSIPLVFEEDNALADRVQALGYKVMIDCWPDGKSPICFVAKIPCKHLEDWIEAAESRAGGAS